MKKVKQPTKTDQKKINDFNQFACTHKFYSQATQQVDQSYFIMVWDQVTINTKCEASYADLLWAWRLHNK